MATVSSVPNRILQPGDEMAILPAAHSSPADVLEIAAICRVGSVFIQLRDGRMYATIGGKSLGSHSSGYAVPATDEHRMALKAKFCLSTASA